jgi:hypothetical protein
VALVRNIEPTKKERQTRHEETTCLSSVFTDGSGERYIQLDTYGSKLRKMPNKVSQAVQFTESAAAQLRSLIEATFPRLRR